MKQTGIMTAAMLAMALTITAPVYAAKLDLSDSRAHLMRTRLREAAEQPPNFAGHYRVVTWGCGTNCLSGAVIDKLTGRVVFLPSDGEYDDLGFDLKSSILKFMWYPPGDARETPSAFIMEFDGKNFRQR